MTNTSRRHSTPIITDFRNFTLDFKQLGFCASPLFLQTPDLDFQRKSKIYFIIWKEDFGPLSQTVQFFFLHSPGKMLLKLSLVQKISLWSSPKCLNQLCEQSPLSVMTFCDLPSLSMIVFWTIAKSAVFPIIVVSKNKRYPEFGNLMKLKCKYSNILSYWIFDFHEL